MVQLTNLFGLAGIIATAAQSRAIPSKPHMMHRNVHKPALMNNFNVLTAESRRIPLPVNSTAKKWAPGKYPQNCYDKAREAISHTEPSPKCQLRNLEVYNVTYHDCLTGRDPWVICRCSDAELSLRETMDGMGTVPTGARSNVLNIIVMSEHGSGGGGYSDGNSIFCGGRPQPTWFSHESMHCNDRIKNQHWAYSASKKWTSAIAKDQCVPDLYAATSPAEDFAQVGTYLNYHMNGHRIDYMGKSPTCFQNQLKAAEQFLGVLMEPYGKCFDAPGKDGIIKDKRDSTGFLIVEADPEADFEEILPHTPYTYYF